MQPLDRHSREHFDSLLQHVLERLPTALRELLDQVPVCVEDWPDPELLEDAGCESPDELFGLYTGVPLTEREHDLIGEPSELIHIFRGSLLAAARDAAGRLDEPWLAEQIRITVLHELGHHYGLDEDWLEDRGYG